MNNSQKLIDDILGTNDPLPRETQKNRFGAMIFDHKTAGVCQVMTGSQYSNFKSYQPGRFQKSAMHKVAGKNTAFI